MTQKAITAEKLLNEMLSITPVPEYCESGNPKGYGDISALFFEGAPMGGKRTKVFAYIGFPSGASAESPVPAVVLQHGGGGHAYPEWIKMWTDRGYAAIAVGNTGYIPAINPITSFYSPTSWRHQLTEKELKADPRELIPDNDTTDMNAGDDVTLNWLFHAVAAGILAHNLIEADARVIKGKTGLCGISWGGVITCLTMGFDTRFAYYIPIYGSAHLGESATWMKNHFTPRTLEVFDATVRLHRVSAPILWLNWAEDNAFDITCNDKSYADTASHAVFAMRRQMGHGHVLGWEPLESYRFADWAVKGGELMAVPEGQPSPDSGKSFKLAITVPSDALEVTATINYLEHPLSYGADSHITEAFKYAECTVNKDTVTVNVPDTTVVYYIEIITRLADGSCSSSSRLVRL